MVKSPMKRKSTNPSERGCGRCGGEVFGQEQVCQDCRDKEKLCKDCGSPHGGPPTTKLCPRCRAKHRTKPRARNNPAWTPREDAIIREMYAEHHAREAGRRLREMFPRRPRWSITRRAAVLGAATTKAKEPRWSEAEDALMEEFGWMTPERVVLKLRNAGFKRTVMAVSVRIKRMRIHQKIGGMSAHGLAEMLGIDMHAVLRWIDEGELVAERSGTTGDHHDRWHITTDAIRAFILAHPERIELSKLERVGSRMWFLELITGGLIAEGRAAPRQLPQADAGPAPGRTLMLYGERVSLPALADISGKSVADLLHRVDGLGMSVEGAAFGEDDGAGLGGMMTGAGSPMAMAIADQVRALMKRHKVKIKDLAKWSAVPDAIIERLLAGEAPILSVAVVGVVANLDGEIELTIRPKARSYDATG